MRANTNIKLKELGIQLLMFWCILLGILIVTSL